MEFLDHPVHSFRSCGFQISPGVNHGFAPLTISSSPVSLVFGSQGYPFFLDFRVCVTSPLMTPTLLWPKGLYLEERSHRTEWPKWKDIITHQTQISVLNDPTHWEGISQPLRLLAYSRRWEVTCQDVITLWHY